MISDGQTYLFLLAFMIFSSASLSVINCDTRADSNESLRIIEVIEGEPIVLPCELTNTLGYEINWAHNDLLITDRSQRVHQVDDKLHISATNRHDSGYYNCIASKADSSRHGRRISNTIKLEIVWLKSAEIVYHAPESASLKPHNNFALVLHCRVNGNRLHEVRWFKNSQQIEASPSIDIDNDMHRLIIKHPTTNDDGNYNCMARNRVGSVYSDSYRVEIHTSPTSAQNSNYFHSTRLYCSHKTAHANAKPKILLCRHKRSDVRLHRKRAAAEELNQQPDAHQKSMRKRLSVSENDSITINCDLRHSDRKVGQFVWKKDGKLFRQSNVNDLSGDLANMNPISENSLLRDDGRVSMNSKNGSLTIANTIPSDAGIYECLIFKSGDSIFSMQTTELSIIEKLKFSPLPTSKGLEIGKLGKVHCKVQGTPIPQVHWQKDSHDTLPDMIEDVNGTLVFKNVTESDRGNYTCVAANSQGQISATVVITPVIAPQFVVKPLGPIQVNEMASVMIHCVATGDPKPKIQWDKDLDYLNITNSETSRLIVLDNGTLYFSEVHLEDEGLYGCTIGSSAGFKREEAHLTVRPAEELTSDDNPEGSFFVVRAVLITVTVVFSYIILVVGLMFWCRIKRKARKNRMQLIAKENNDTFTGNDTRPNDENEPCLPEKNHRKNGNGWVGANNETMTNNTKDSVQKTDETKVTKKSNLDQITMPRTILFDITQIGRGEFGLVYVAKVKASDLKPYLNKDAALVVTNEGEKQNSKTSLDDINEIKEDNETNDDTARFALIKALNKVKDESVCIEFRRQLDMFRAVSHRNVVKLFGLCRDKDPHYLVLEHTDLGDLKEFLAARASQMDDLNSKNGIVHKNNMETAAAAITSIKLHQLLLITQQIARGMDAIYRARYIHRDLAARNCVIGSDLTVKVSYPAILKEKYAREYFKLKNLTVPLRWMAPECIEEDDCTIKSDVYSFGVLVWELFTFCTQLPLEKTSDEEFLSLLQTNKLERTLPNSVPEDISSTLLSCWKQNPKERPSFSTINSVISKHLQKLPTTT